MRLEDVSRARVQEMIAEGLVLLNDAPAKASLKLRGGEREGAVVLEGWADSIEDAARLVDDGAVFQARPVFRVLRLARFIQRRLAAA